jgi:hypothetical protein
MGGALWSAASLAGPTGVATPVFIVCYRDRTRIEMGACLDRFCCHIFHLANGKWYGIAVPTAVGLASEAALHGMPVLICGFA